MEDLLARVDKQRKKKHSGRVGGLPTQASACRRQFTTNDVPLHLWALSIVEELFAWGFLRCNGNLPCHLLRPCSARQNRQTRCTLLTQAHPTRLWTRSLSPCRSVVWSEGCGQLLRPRVKVARTGGIDILSSGTFYLALERSRSPCHSVVWSEGCEYMALCRFRSRLDENICCVCGEPSAALAGSSVSGR
jgi:hypothetical protein